MQWSFSRIGTGIAVALGVALSAVSAQQARAQEGQPSARSISYGKEVYRTGNCIGCHKWHGNGGGGYGGLALSLRATTLDRNALVEIVRCGRPGTHMPYHDMKAWEEGRCFGGAKQGDFDPKVFPSFGVSLTEREMQSVVDYVMATLQGKGEPTREECLAFWGSSAERVCKPYEAVQQ
jgi:mono/diheme cytochrome c family protein